MKNFTIEAMNEVSQSRILIGDKLELSKCGEVTTAGVYLVISQEKPMLLHSTYVTIKDIVLGKVEKVTITT